MTQSLRRARPERAPDQSLPYGRHFIDDEDIDAVVAVLKSARLTTGPMVERFEAALRDVTGAPFAVVCANGTAALHLSAAALGLGPQSTVIVPSVTFAATANAARFTGARVRFVDVDPENGLMRPSDLEAALVHGKADAVFPVHFAGQTTDIEHIGAIARKHGLAVVEDACHALGSDYIAKGKEQPVGSGTHSDLTVFSFHAVKTVAMGEGGAVTTRNETLAQHLRQLRNHGAIRDPAGFEQTELGFDSAGCANPWYYELTELGFNYRASDIACALGAAQLKKLARFCALRRRLVEAYERALAPLAPAIRPIKRVPWCTPAWHLMAVLIDFTGLGIERGTVMARLAERGIGTQVHYVPLHMQPYYRKLRADWGDRTPLPGAEAYYSRCLALPLFVGMNESDVSRVVDTLAEVISL